MGDTSRTDHHQPLREFYQPRHPNFAVWESEERRHRGAFATPPDPLTNRHQLLPLFVQRMGSHLFVLALAPELGKRGRAAETAAIVARDYAARVLIRNGKIFHCEDLDY